MIVQVIQRRTKAKGITKSGLKGNLVPPDISPQLRARDVKLVLCLQLVLDGPPSSSLGGSMLNQESERQPFRHFSQVSSQWRNYQSYLLMERRVRLRYSKL